MRAGATAIDANSARSPDGALNGGHRRSFIEDLEKPGRMSRAHQESLCAPTKLADCPMKALSLPFVDLCIPGGQHRCLSLCPRSRQAWH
jgi:hypothetical protein